MRIFPRDSHPRARLAVELVVVVLGVLALAWAWRADLRYCERHLLARYYAYDEGEIDVARRWRIAGVVTGLALIFVVRPLLGRWAGRRSPGEAIADVSRYVLAVVLALVVSEIGLRVMHVAGPRDRTRSLEVRIGQRDPKLGWTYVASKRTVITQGGRDIEYCINADQNRAAHVEDVPDLAAPTMIFTGESIAAGHGLTWDESYPAIVGKALGVQVVDLGVHGYGSDQAFLRLVDALPRFQHVVAVVSIFHPPMLERMTADDHPHLVFDGHEPRLIPGTSFFRDLRISKVWRSVIPYRDGQPYELAKQIAYETDRLARQHGTRALFVYPQFNSDVPRRDAWLVDELFRDQGLSVLDYDFRFVAIPDDNHPDAPSTARLAGAIIEKLRSEISQR